ncbi:TIGR04348 family glycosyltransferase [Comamonadaceae bacterium OTU4NAUVB1]|nr:TIGR04348 family glycosyltransferase [Comamonadaceae bacterium OTU4NAUVB1]
MNRPSICIVTPALADANNGNWQTARRWSRMLGGNYRIDLVARWDGTPADALIALHARRSADSVARWAEAAPGRPSAVVLTGTDLYRDILHDPVAVRSLRLADRLVVLHERAVADLPPAFRAKAVACFQSTTSRVPAAKPRRHLRAVMVGHLREEKSPGTYFAAARRLAGRPEIRLDHVGAALDAALGREAQALQAAQPAYRWLGARPHAEARRRIQAAHVLVHPSLMEGGAHVVMEAVRSGTPVLASRIAGNVGMLGPDYAGYFEPGDDAGLAALLESCRDDRAILDRLAAQCALRAPLFDPARERATLRALLAAMLETSA